MSQLLIQHCPGVFGSLIRKEKLDEYYKGGKSIISKSHNDLLGKT